MCIRDRVSTQSTGTWADRHIPQYALAMPRTCSCFSSPELDSDGWYMSIPGMDDLDLKLRVIPRAGDDGGAALELTEVMHYHSSDSKANATSEWDEATDMIAVKRRGHYTVVNGGSSFALVFGAPENDDGISMSQAGKERLAMISERSGTLELSSSLEDHDQAEPIISQTCRDQAPIEIGSLLPHEQALKEADHFLKISVTKGNLWCKTNGKPFALSKPMSTHLWFKKSKHTHDCLIL
eukprot:TRINITY_DN7223_c0_g1_i4.p1 TRINITY_DN7223_c0_g1~~TRINITY_DN7223_c0_g1_i4.p1  ORF type:complete len:238 (-),score=45.28 TRINITY_DN7223_c0_g1_i4:212-925(-)